jgi:hypothetical protein
MRSLALLQARQRAGGMGEESTRGGAGGAAVAAVPMAAFSAASAASHVDSPASTIGFVMEPTFFLSWSSLLATHSLPHSPTQSHIAVPLAVRPALRRRRTLVRRTCGARCAAWRASWTSRGTSWRRRTPTWSC